MSKKYYFKSSKLSLYKDKDKYFKNDEELKAEGESEEYTEIKFDKEIKNAVSSWVNNRFDNIVCLIGAGASVVQGEDGYPDKQYGQTVQMIADEVLFSLKNKKYVLDKNELEVFTLEELITKIKYKEVISKKDSTGEEKQEVIKNFIINQDKEPVEKLSNNFNLENFLSVFLSYEKFVPEEDEEKFGNSRKAIFQEIIKATSYEYTSDKFYHAKFLNILSKLVKKEQKLNIVTTNYDTLLEDSANAEGFTVLDGFKFAQLPIFDASMFDWHLIKDVPNVKTQEVEYMSKVINLLKIHGSLTWELSPTGKNILRKSKGNVTNPVMVFPSSDKYAQSYQEPYFELFAKFQELLKRSNTLLITSGFSFADNHISRMILQAVKSNGSLHVLATDYDIEPNEPNENWSELVKMQEKDYQIALLKATMNDKLTGYLGGDNEY
ncbi:SIR2 family protein [Lactococcus lactis]|uniref:SIR2 family protein n=1 Tax=Lactococcus lactis TaxID=1358 RepID=UPI0021A91D7B|nr:SIR2 family protein [Lactococcus lactis]MCT3124474.1 SIR2 family protein [Lactococcus lactis]